MTTQPLTQPWLALAIVAGAQVNRQLVNHDGSPVNGSGWKNAVAALLGVSYSTVASRLSGAKEIPESWFDVAGLDIDGSPKAPPTWLATWDGPGQALASLSVPSALRMAQTSMATGRELSNLLTALLAHLRDMLSGVAEVQAGRSSVVVYVGVRFNGCPAFGQVLEGVGSVSVKSTGWSFGQLRIDLSQEAVTTVSVSWFVDGRRR